ncbi:MAG: hypothetical protein IKJ35_08975 [Clostridia bacterium]|nr:hypothetical protein [Clostridia bacterium]
MDNAIFDFILYFFNLVILTLGVFAGCGLSVRLCSLAFARLSGSGSGTVFDVTSIIGTPIHELGHAAMCPLFGHRITSMKLWSPRAENGVYGFVEHSYNKRNPWARMGNLFIGIGPLFSGLGFVILMLWICFPMQWNDYLVASRALISSEQASAGELFSAIFSLLIGIFKAFASNWIRSLLGMIVILAVSLHVSLSWADVKDSLGALPVYLIMLAIFAIPTAIAGLSESIVLTLRLFNLRLLSIFCIIIAFAALWVLIALLVRLVIALIRAF